MAVLDDSSGAQHMNSGALPGSPAAAQHDNPPHKTQLANGDVNDTGQGSMWAEISLGPSDEPSAKRSKLWRASSLIHVGRPPLEDVPEDIPMSRMPAYTASSQGLDSWQDSTTSQSTAHLFSRTRSASSTVTFNSHQQHICSVPPANIITTTTTIDGDAQTRAARRKFALDWDAVRDYGARYLVPTVIHGFDATLMLLVAIDTTTSLTGHVLTNLGWFVVCTSWVVAMLDILFILMYNLAFFCLSPRTGLRCRLMEAPVSVLIVLLQFAGGIYTTVQILLGYKYAPAAESYGPPSDHFWIATTELTHVWMSVCYFASFALWSCAGVYAVTKGLDGEAVPERRLLLQSSSAVRAPETRSAMDVHTAVSARDRVDRLQGLGAQSATV